VELPQYLSHYRRCDELWGKRAGGLAIPAPSRRRSRYFSAGILASGGFAAYERKYPRSSYLEAIERQAIEGARDGSMEDECDQSIH
jgi:hypothetical protein